jgi:hypothetical protein
MSSIYIFFEDEINFTVSPLPGQPACLSEKAYADMLKKKKKKKKGEKMRLVPFTGRESELQTKKNFQRNFCCSST